MDWAGGRCWLDRYQLEDLASKVLSFRSPTVCWTPRCRHHGASSANPNEPDAALRLVTVSPRWAGSFRLPGWVASLAPTPRGQKRLQDQLPEIACAERLIIGRRLPARPSWRQWHGVATRQPARGCMPRALPLMRSWCGTFWLAVWVCGLACLEQRHRFAADSTGVFLVPDSWG
jgi:hypothetical protein